VYKLLMKNIGVFGLAGSGKGTVADFFAKKYGYKSITMSDVLRSIARKKKIKPTRKNLEKIQREYRKKYGNDFVIKNVLKKIKNNKKPLILDGLRSIADVKRARKNLKIKLILVHVDPKIRFERLKKRGRTGFSKTFKEFKEMEARENKIFRFKKVFRYANYKVNNNTNKQNTYKQLKALVKKLK